MNNAKMWLVVPPAVGVPVFLGAVAVGSFSVHVAVLSNTSWVSDFLSGEPLGSGDAQASAEMLAPQMETAKAAYTIDSANGDRQIMVILQDGTMAQATLHQDKVLASATAASPPLVIDQ